MLYSYVLLMCAVGMVLRDGNMTTVKANEASTSETVATSTVEGTQYTTTDTVHVTTSSGTTVQQATSVTFSTTPEPVPSNSTTSVASSTTPVPSSSTTSVAPLTTPVPSVSTCGQPFSCSWLTLAAVCAGSLLAIVCLANCIMICLVISSRRCKKGAYQPTNRPADLRESSSDAVKLQTNEALVNADCGKAEMQGVVNLEKGANTMTETVSDEPLDGRLEGRTAGESHDQCDKENTSLQMTDTKADEVILFEDGTELKDVPSAEDPELLAEHETQENASVQRITINNSQVLDQPHIASSQKSLNSSSLQPQSTGALSSGEPVYHVLEANALPNETPKLKSQIIDQAGSASSRNSLNGLSLQPQHTSALSSGEHVYHVLEAKALPYETPLKSLESYEASLATKRRVKSSSDLLLAYEVVDLMPKFNRNSSTCHECKSLHEYSKLAPKQSTHTSQKPQAKNNIPDYSSSYVNITIIPEVKVSSNQVPGGKLKHHTPPKRLSGSDGCIQSSPLTTCTTAGKPVHDKETHTVAAANCKVEEDATEKIRTALTTHVAKSVSKSSTAMDTDGSSVKESELYGFFQDLNKGDLDPDIAACFFS